MAVFQFLALNRISHTPNQCLQDYKSNQVLIQIQMQIYICTMQQKVAASIACRKENQMQITFKEQNSKFLPDSQKKP